ncbi:hypothetical protein F4820DRAFT_448568 [Hypoxylon rubiginosum]|uniref:Uncharacterized protein n=1 Tax=Hypoxylon rubiginosum TaxID=110542 RepID=A0ACB9YZQ9_9PEZI|nr:hypothetical protein F4820DRAFT_448568 [Hypoxylon rubiginosum]
MAQTNAGLPDDEELVSQYFDLDEASCESEDFGRLDGNIPGFNPIVKQKNNSNRRRLEEDIPWENFSGGIGCYVFPWSSNVMMGCEAPSTREMSESLGRKRKPTLEDSYAVKRRKSQENQSPSAAGGIVWNNLFREVFQKIASQPPSGEDHIFTW